MILRRFPSTFVALWIGLVTLTGCYSSSPPPSGTTETPRSASANGSAPSADLGKSASNDGTTATGDEYPDIPKIEILKEIDGIAIPRLKTDSQSIQLTGEIPVDVNNPRVEKAAGEKATGDQVTVLFNAEPKTLNPITENSAYKSYILLRNVQEDLAQENFETFEFEPKLAERWIIEDSVKLSPEYPGKERRVKLTDGEPQTQIEFNYTAPAPPEGKAAKDEPPVITVITTDKDGQPLPGVWIGVYPKEKILGAPTTGYHTWSDDQGFAKLGNYPTGAYLVKVGAEVYGKTTKQGDGSLVVIPATDENPLHSELQSTPNSTLTLKPDEWIDRHEQTYFTYYLRPDVKWSDGAAFTTKDIEFAYALLNNPFVDGDHIRVYYSDLVDCAALSPQVVRMRYRQQYFKAFESTAEISHFAPPWHVYAKRFQSQGKELTLERLTPDEESAQKKISARGQEFGQFFNLDQEYNRAPLGTGPYAVAKWENGDRLELNRNPNYWLPERAGYLDKIVYKFIIDASGWLPALQTGIVDFVPRLNQEQYFEVLNGPPEWFAKDFVKADWFTPVFNYVGWNELKPVFQDRRVRIALGMLFDKQRFLETKMHNAAMIVSGSAYYFGPGYDHNVAPLDYSPETARELLTEAGWIDSDNDGLLDKDGKPFTIKTLYPKGNPLVDDLLALMKNDLKSVGIEMDIRPMEWASFYELVQQRDFDVITLSWAMPVESDPYQIWHGSGAGKNNRGSNHVSFNNSQANELIETLRLTLDPKKRQQIALAFHRLVDAEQPYQFLYCPKNLGAYHQRFRGVKWYRIRPGYDLTEWYVPKDEQVHR